MARRHVVPRADGWAVKAPGAKRASSVHKTQGSAEKAAKQIVSHQGGGEVVIHRPNGQIRDSDTVAPGHDPFPPRDNH
jgi:butyrate kinase